jgi:hypothetical protein
MRVMLSSPSLNRGQWVMLLGTLAQRKGGEKLPVCHSVMRILKALFCMLIIILYLFSALLKQQRVDPKGAAKSTTPVNEEVPPLLDGGGKLEVALMNIPFYELSCL